MFARSYSRRDCGWDAAAPFDPARELGAALIEPTRIYVTSCLTAIRETKAVKALAHITGGGFTENIPRVLPKGLGAEIDLSRVPVTPLFRWLAGAGNVAEREMLRTFNCGIGMIVVAQADRADAVAAAFTSCGESTTRLGTVVPAEGDAARVTFNGRLDLAR